MSAQAHFRLLGLCAAGRDEGSFRFETTSLVEQIDFYLRLLRAVARLGYRVERVRVAVTTLDAGREHALVEQVLTPLQADHPDVACAFDPDRTTGRGYYVGACFHVYAANEDGVEFEFIDGGFTTWTQQMLSSGLGTELLCGRFRIAPAQSD